MGEDAKDDKRSSNMSKNNSDLKSSDNKSRKESKEESRLREKLKRKKEGRDRGGHDSSSSRDPKHKNKSPDTDEDKAPSNGKGSYRDRDRDRGSIKNGSDGNKGGGTSTGTGAKPSKPGVNTKTNAKDKTSAAANTNGNGSNSVSTSGKPNSKRNRNKRRRERRREAARERMRNDPHYGHGPPGPGPYGYDPRHGPDPRYGRGHGPPEMMDSRAYYSQDYHGGRGPGPGPGGRHEPYGHGRGGAYRGRGGRGGWDPRRGGGHLDGRGGGRYDGYRGVDRERDRDRDRFGRHYRGGSAERERGRSRSRTFSRSRSRNRSGSSASARSYSSASDRSYSSAGSRSSSRSRSRSYSSSRSRSRSRNRDRKRDRSRSSDKKRDRSRSSDDGSSRARHRSDDGSSRARHRSMSPSKSRSRSRERHSRDRSSPRDRKRPRRSSSASSNNPPGTGTDTGTGTGVGAGTNKGNKEDELTKDQRTVFVSQLVMKADARDIRKYFYKKLRLKVNDVILLRDKRTGRHKGCAYVELAHLADVPKSVEASGKVPDFQRFPILVKASEAEKNGLGVVTNFPMGVGVGGIGALGLGVVGGDINKRTEAQKVYIGNIDLAVTQSQLYAIFSQFGQLDRVLLQLDPATGLSKGFAFLSFQDPKVANLALTTISGQLLAGKAMKTGWANQNSTVAGLEEVSSKEFPDDSVARIEKANVVFKQLNGTGLAQTTNILLVPGMASQILDSDAAKTTLSPEAIASQYAILAEEAVNLALGQPPSTKPSAVPLPPSLQTEDVDDPKMVKGDPSRHILVRNMFDKDEETEEGWAEDIKLDFQEESGKHGKITAVRVMSQESGGKIYTSFESMEGAAACAANLAGRWFDKRQLRVEFVSDAVLSGAS